MKILSTFDTAIKERKLLHYQEIHGINNVILISKSYLYLIQFVWIPIILSVWMIMWLLYIIRLLTDWDTQTVVYVGIPLGALLLWYIIVNSIFRHIVDYKMDFCIITPNEIEKFDQTGILQRDVNALSLDKIKSVNIRKKWFFYSLFNNGDVIFMSEWDVIRWEIALRYVQNPDIVKKKALKLLNKSIE